MLKERKWEHKSPLEVYTLGLARHHFQHILLTKANFKTSAKEIDSLHTQGAAKVVDTWRGRELGLFLQAIYHKSLGHLKMTIYCSY